MVNGGLLPFHLDQSIVPTGHVEDWYFWKCTVSRLGGRVQRCDCSKSFSTFNKQVVGESSIGVSGRNTSRHQQCHATKSSSMTSKKEGHDSSWHLHPIASRTSPLGSTSFAGVGGLGDKRHRRWPVLMDAKLSGCTSRASTMTVPDKDNRLQALVQLREMHQPGAPSELTFHFISRREGDD